MSRIPVISLFVAAWAASFAATQIPPFRTLVSIPFQITPALVVYAALTHSLTVTICLAFAAGLFSDVLGSGSPGTTILPLLGLATAIHVRRHLILRDQPYAQFWIGALAGALVPLGTWIVALQVGPAPATDPGIPFRCLLLGLLNGLACPMIFVCFDLLKKAFDYETIATTSFRSDRIILRGKT